MTILLATGNAGKVADFAGLGPAIHWQPLPEFATLPGIEETGSSFEANARIKAEHYSQFTDEVLLADDSGLEVEALAGAPGIYSARFAGTHGDDAANNRLLLEKLDGLPVERRMGRFVCCLALAQGGKTLATFHGLANGIILKAPRGTGGFGYDPLFFCPEAAATFGELTPQEKAKVSHRARAARALLDWLRQGKLPAPPPAGD